jgi:GNAT superfamily N-acetyltransferase
MTIRPALASDSALILEFIQGLADYEHLAHEVEATEDKIRTALFPVLGHPAAECVLAFEGPEPAGFALYFSTFSTFLARPGIYLEDIFVKPHLRGRGIGRALLLHLTQLANERGCGRLEWAVLDWNEPAIRFYENLGARRLTDWTICRLTGEALRQHARRPAPHADLS